MAKLKILGAIPSLRLLPGKPLLCQISMRVHVKTEQEYHSQAYALRMNGASTEFLIADPDHRPTWIDMTKIEIVE
jgi:hypothetical protein